MSSYFSSVEKDNKRALEPCSQTLAVDHSNADLMMGGIGRDGAGALARDADPRRACSILGSPLGADDVQNRCGPALDVAACTGTRGLGRCTGNGSRNLAALEMKAVAILGQGDLTAARAEKTPPGRSGTGAPGDVCPPAIPGN